MVTTVDEKLRDDHYNRFVPVVNRRQLLETIDLLKDLPSSCTCITKTNDPSFHKEGCGYRILMERRS